MGDNTHGEAYKRIIEAAEQAAKDRVQKIKNYSVNNPTDPHTFGCMNADRTKITFLDGFEANIVVVGNPTPCTPVTKINANTYLAEGPLPNITQADGKTDKLYFIKLKPPAGATENHYFGGLGDVTFLGPDGRMAGAKYYLINADSPGTEIEIPFPNHSELIDPLGFSGPTYGRGMFSPNGKHIALWGSGYPGPGPSNLNTYWIIYHDWAIKDGAITASEIEQGDLGAETVLEHLGFPVFSSTGVGNFYFGNYPNDKGRLDFVTILSS